MKHEFIFPTQFPIQKELLKFLKKRLSLHSVYVISNSKEKKTQNVNLFPQSITSEKLIIYTLLIISYKPISKNIGKFMDDLYHKMHQQCKVYPMFYILDDVKRKLDFGSNFLNRTINQAPCIYRADDSLLCFGRNQFIYHKTNYDRIQIVWNSRMKRAAYLLSAVNFIDIDEELTARIGILHIVLEQVCAALLFLFWEFTPYYYSLSYLFHLCSDFTQLPQTIFPQKTFESQRMFYMLCNAHHQMRYKSQNKFSERDSDKAYELCDRFFCEALSLGEKKLEELKEYHC